MIANRPCTASARHRAIVTHNYAVATNLDHAADLGSLEDGTSADCDMVANLHGIVREGAGNQRARRSGSRRTPCRSCTADGRPHPRRSGSTCLRARQRLRVELDKPIAITTVCPEPARLRSPRITAAVWMIVLPPRMMFWLPAIVCRHRGGLRIRSTHRLPRDLVARVLSAQPQVQTATQCTQSQYTRPWSLGRVKVFPCWGRTERSVVVHRHRGP